MTPARNPQRFMPGRRHRVNSSPRRGFAISDPDTVIIVPESDEQESLTDLCSECDLPVRPVVVVRCPRGGDIAAYNCWDCGSRWVSAWADLTP
jgi:hypothetical protein